MAALGVRYRGVIEKWLLGAKFDHPRRESQRIKELHRCIEDDQEELARLEKEEETETED